MNDTDELQERVKLLEIGRKYTWRELLNILNLQFIKNGKGRLDLIAKIKRYINYKRIGQSYIVTEIFDDPIPKIHAAKYSNPALVLLLKALQDNGKNMSYVDLGFDHISDYSLFIILCLCNRTIFGSESDRLKEIARKYPGTIVTEEQVKAYRAFYYKNMSVVREQVRGIRKTLTDNKFLYWERIFYVKTYGQAPNAKPIEATDNQTAWITEAQRLALKEMGCTKEFSIIKQQRWRKDHQDKMQLVLESRWQEYKEKALANLQRLQVIVNENEHIKDFEKVNKIIFHKAGIEAGLALYSDNCGIELNNLMLDKLIATYNWLLSWDATVKNEENNADGWYFESREEKFIFNSDHIGIAEITIEGHHTLPESDRKAQLSVITTCQKVPDTGLRKPKHIDLVNASMTPRELLS